MTSLARITARPEAIEPIPVVDYVAATPPRTGDEGVFSIGEFAFERGGRLDDLRVGYTTHGRLNAARDNAVLLTPGTANTRHSADGYIGPGNALDPERDFIIAVDAIGAGTSSKPSHGLRGDFPQYTIRDMVRAEHALVTGAFGLTRLKAVVGASMGAFQALEWTIQFPDFVERAALLVPGWRAGNVFQSAVAAAIDLLKLDANWNGEDFDAPPLAGLRAAGRLYYPWTVSDAYLEQLPAEELEREMANTVERAAAWDAWDFTRRYLASASHDISEPFGGDYRAALSRVRAEMLILPVSTDRLLPVEQAREIAAHVRGARYVEVPSLRGHLGWRAVRGAPETKLIAAEISQFLSRSNA